METRLSGKETFSRDRHWKNACSSIRARLPPRSISFNARHRLNTLGSSRVIFRGSVTRSSFTQFSNASRPILFKFCGKEIFCRSRQSRKAPEPISSRLAGRITRSMVSFPAKASSAITVIPSGTTTLDSAPRYFNRTVPLIRKFPSTCLWMVLTVSGISEP